MTNLYRHYKDKNPVDTINTISQFFREHNCEIITNKEFYGENGTYSAVYDLIYNQEVILSANGKGTDPFYCQASGYAEIYERFCLFGLHFRGNFYSQQYYNNSHINTLKEIDENNDEFIQTFFKIKSSVMSDDIDNKNKQIKEIFFNNKILGNKYINLITNQEKYFNSYMLYYFLGSNGAAAGNTIEEALVQGICEIFERYAISLFWHQPQNVYYYLNPQSLSCDIQDIINKIEDTKKYKVYIYDLSYNFNLPVCIVVLKNLIYHNYTIMPGAHLDINIAIERCLTELYQGYDKLPDKKFIINNNQLTVDEQVYWNFREHYHTINLFPEMLINHSQTIDQINYDIYIKSNSNITNTDLLTFCKNICLKNNINLYYTDISLMKDMIAVYVISEPILNYEFIQQKLLTINNYNINKIQLLKLKSCLNNNFNNLEIFQDKNILQFMEFDIFDIFFIQGSVCQRHRATPIFCKILNNNYDQITREELQYLNMNLYNIFQNFIFQNNKKLIKYFNYNQAISLNDISQVLINLYNSKQYFDFLNIYNKSLIN